MRNRTIFLLLFLLLFTPLTFGQTDKQINLYSDWVQLSLIGKSHEELEFLFRGIAPAAIESLKHRLRSNVIQNLNRMGLKKMVVKARDRDDLTTIREKILIEIRYNGLQDDEVLLVAIKEEFGINFELF